MKDYVLLSGSLGLLMAIGILWLIRRDHMHVQYSLWWLALGSGALILGFFPSLVDVVGRALGIAYPPTLGLLIAIIALFLKALLGDIERSRTKRRLLRLTQRVVILQQRLEELESSDVVRKEHS